MASDRVLKTCEWCKWEMYIFPEGRFCSRACSAQARHARGDNISLARKLSGSLTIEEYRKVHWALRSKRGRATRCVNGCTDAKRYDWANLTGDYFNLDDYQQMCRSCHIKMDRARVTELMKAERSD